jgi:D-alanyl-D-alanine dipeptidase
MKEQFSEIRAGEPARLSREGVNCVTCHVREGGIHSATSSGLQFHPWSKDQRLKKAEFCAGCHQFNFNKTVDGHAFLTPLTVQNTYNEWLAYRGKGGRKTCQGCHMPDGKHTFQGAHTEAVLAGGIDLKVKAEARGYAFILQPKNVGHRVPTGDLFRHLTLEVAEGQEFKTIATIGRKYGVRVDDQTGNAVQELKEDTSLGPFERRVVHFKSDGGIRYRLVYHYTSPRDELRSLLKPEELKTIVTSGTLSRESAGTAGDEPLVKLEDERFILDLRYKTPDNFLKTDVYGPLGLDACYVLPELKEKVIKLVPELRKRGLKLIFWDCFRPLSIQRKMWALVPDARYVADPKTGSNHNRGCAIDLTLATEDGKPLEMPTAFDSFERKAHLDFKCPPEEKARCENRELLIELMKRAGLAPLPTEWWHFQLPDAAKYPVRESLH